MIEIQNIKKKYAGSSSNALDGITLTIKDGEFFGLLGLNGAGKTTMINILSTLLLPTEGCIFVDGELLSRKREDVKRKISLVTQYKSLRNDMTVEQVLEFQGRLYGISREKIRIRSSELLEFCDLTEFRKRTVRKLSGGMKRKVMICRALLTEPEILILDEPTVGLDPVSRRQTWELLRKLNHQGMTILLTTHYMDEAQQLCERVALMDRGQVKAIDAPQTLIRSLGEAAVDIYKQDGTETCFFSTQAEAREYAAGIDLSCGFSIRSTTLEDVFLKRLERRSDD